MVSVVTGQNSLGDWRYCKGIRDKRRKQKKTFLANSCQIICVIIAGVFTRN